MLTRLPLWIVTFFLILGANSLLVAEDESPAQPKESEAPAAQVEGEEHPEGEKEHAEEPGHEKEGEHDEAHGEEGHEEEGHGEGEHGEGHGAAHHDPHDLSHNDASASIGAAEEVTWGLATYTFIVFIGLVAVLTVFAWKPIMAALDERERSMDGKIAEAKKMFDEAEEKLTEYKQKLADAQQEIQQSRDQILRDADEKRQQIVSDAHEAAQSETERAKLEINAAKSQAIDELTQQSVNLAVDLAGKIVKKQLSAEDHAQLINEAISQLPSRN